MYSGHILKREQYISGTFRLVDILTILLSSLLVSYVQFGVIQVTEKYVFFITTLCFVTLNIFNFMSVYRAWRGKAFIQELVSVTLALLVVSLIMGALVFLFRTGDEFSRLWVGSTFITAYVGMIGYRSIARVLIRYLRATGHNQKRIVVVGAGVLGKRVCSTISRETWAGVKAVALFDDEKALHGSNYRGVEVIGGVNDVAGFIESYRSRDSHERIDHVWIALPLSARDRIEYLQEKLQDTAASVYLVPDLYGFNLDSYKVDEMIGMPIMNMSASSAQGWRAILKRIEDLTIASVLLVLLSPVFAIVAYLIKSDSKGPVFFKQKRYGIDGKEILVWKFRSMSVTENGGEVKQAQRTDPRVTKIGAFIRKTSIDELPQLINVLQGTMSLVGPRPHAVAHNEFYRSKVMGYMARHKMHPGITGWAQVNGSRGETVEVRDMEERIRYDLEYIKHWSLGLDFKILFRTISTVLNTKNTY
ncbi:undecaprenyl-phosphate glucose phosphotransferase [Leucothrix arctica]|uniref:Undecaprenyl-phosphate glucose phosphotransferase n=1 Tax=Leucothrix arctica TaxID=1481894 RepID=A0A317CJH5_9GAMM|nr:undecaprenyl-phosphate glucose phosphotransferase [Leucothrix arctica]PWQ98708.1 undecaprenyl-phosphate glucose phosphotransferase [Leucothrix arctica]